MQWWGIVLIVMFCDYTAMFFLGRHLTKKAELAVVVGINGIQEQLMAFIGPLLKKFNLTIEDKETQEVMQVGKR